MSQMGGWLALSTPVSKKYPGGSTHPLLGPKSSSAYSTDVLEQVSGLVHLSKYSHVSRLAWFVPQRLR